VATSRWLGLWFTSIRVLCNSCSAEQIHRSLPLETRAALPSARPDFEAIGGLTVTPQSAQLR
jgi:hypothetical protein